MLYLYVQVSLNEGGHQLRLYHQGPTGLDPLCESSMRDEGTQYVPCATLLLRLVKAPIGPQGKALEVRLKNIGLIGFNVLVGLFCSFLPVTH